MNALWHKLRALVAAIPRAVLLTLAAVLLVWLGMLLGGQYLRYYETPSGLGVRVADAPVRSVLWEEPTRLPGPLNDLRRNREATFSPDGQRLLLVREFSAGNLDLFISRRGPEGWQRPEPLPGFNTRFNEAAPYWAPDGTLYFASDRTGTLGGMDLWRTRESADGSWETPVGLGPELNSPYDETDPSLTADGAFLFFASNRPRDEAAEPAEDFDLFRAWSDPEAAGFRFLERLRGVNTDASERRPLATAGGDWLYFASNREGGYGLEDVYRARWRVGPEYSAGENLGPIINSPWQDRPSYTSATGFEVLFATNRATRTIDDFTFFTTATREVDLRFDWALLRRLLLIALLVVAAIVAVHYLLKVLLTRRSMSLLTRSLLASVLVHIILLLLSGGLYLTSQIGEQLRERADEMTISVTTLARETVALAVRESVSSMQAVQAAPTAQRAAERWTLPDQQPREVQAEPVEARPVREQASELAQSLTQSEDYLRSLDPARTAALVEPAEFGLREAPLEVPSERAVGTSGNEPTVARTEGRGQGRDAPAYEVIPLDPIPMELVQAPNSDAPIATDVPTAPVFASQGSPSVAASPGDRVVGRDPSEDLAQIRSAAGRSPLRSSLATTAGTLLFDAGFTLEEADFDRDDRTDQTLGLLTQDRSRAQRAGIEVRHFGFSSMLAEILETALTKENRLSLDAFSFVRVLIEESSLGRVGSDLREDIPPLQIPVDAEMEVPEAWTE